MQSPFDNANEPPPTPATSNGLNSQAGVVSTAAVSQAWENLRPNLAPWIGISLVYLLTIGALYFIESLLMSRDARGLPQHNPFSLFFVFLISIVAMFMGAGLFKVAIAQLRTGRAEFSEFFNIFDVAAPLFIATVLTSLITSLGFALCVIPGVLASLGLSMTIPLIVDQKLDAIAAMKRSWAACSGQLGNLFLVGLVFFLIYLASLCTCGLATIVILPLLYLTFAIIYRDLFLGGALGAAASMPDFPTPPIANP